MKSIRFYRSVFISDLHLGFRWCQAKAILSFLKSISCEKLYLVGDIFDLWEMKNKIWWNSDCNEIILQLLKMIKNGTTVIYLPGNHDDAIRKFLPCALGEGIEIADEYIHVTSNGNRYAVIHGDRYDVVVGNMKWLAILGSRIYDWLMFSNGYLHSIRVFFGYKKYWSLAGYLKKKTKKAVSFIDDFETALAHHAKVNDCIGVICGHIHNAKLSIVDEIVYANAGDWIESLTAIVETESGELELLQWHCIETHHKK